MVKELEVIKFRQVLHGMFFLGSLELQKNQGRSDLLATYQVLKSTHAYLNIASELFWHALNIEMLPRFLHEIRRTFSPRSCAFSASGVVRDCGMVPTWSRHTYPKAPFRTMQGISYIFSATVGHDHTAVDSELEWEGAKLCR